MTRIETYTASEVAQVIGENDSLLLVHFASVLASPCEFVRRELELLAPVFQDRIRFAEVELPLHDLELIRLYRIEQVPTLILFRGAAEVERLETVHLPEELKEILDAAASFYPEEISGE